MFDQQFLDRYRNKFFGKYRGIVADNVDPEELGRLRLQIPQVYGTSVDGTFAISGWALPTVGGSNNGGLFFIPKRNDMVWVEFEEGDPDRPIWSHGPWTLVYGNNAPMHGRGRFDNTDIVERGNLDTTQSPVANDYATTKTIQTAIGQIEFDEAEGNSRILISHKSGTRIEIRDDGTMEILTSGNQRQISRGSKIDNIAGNRSIRIDGASLEEYVSRNITTSGDDTETITGNKLLSVGNLTEKIGVTVEEDSGLQLGLGQKTTIAGSIVEEVSGASRERVGNKIITASGNMHIMLAGLGFRNPVDLYSNFKVHALDPVFGQINILSGPIISDTGIASLFGGAALGTGFVPPLTNPAGLVPVTEGGINLIAGADPAATPSIMHMGTTQFFLKKGIAGINITPLTVVITNNIGVPEPLLKAIEMLAWAATHTHAMPDGTISGPPVLPPPATAATTAILAN